MEDTVKDLKEMRREYCRGQLREADLPHDPLEAFKLWFNEALEVAGTDANAFVLSTVDQKGHPDARVVLVREFSPKGFVFFGHRDSAKGLQLAFSKVAHLLFVWLELERQVRIRGSVKELPREAVEAYFSKRPRESQLTAWASAQSKIVENREVLENRLKAAEKRFKNRKVACPKYWTGWSVTPEIFEFWQGRPGRLHDRLLYALKGDNWKLMRLNP